MEPSRANRRYLIAETPLSTRDYDIPVGWWGWNWDPPVPMSITEIVRAGNMDARTAALCGLAIAAHGSLLIAAEHPHSGKTTTLTALLDYLPTATRRTVVLTPLVTYDAANDTHAHVPESQRALLAELRQEDAGAAEAELRRRTAALDSWIRQGTFEIPEVRAALAADRGERVPTLLRGDPVQ